MPVAHYDKPPIPTKISDEPRSQYSSSPRGRLHRDFSAYERSEAPVDLFRQNFRLVARSSGRDYDLSGLWEQLTWTDDSAAGASSSSTTIPYMNTNVPLTGSVQLRKPTLSQYKQLVLPVLSGSLDQSRHGVSRWGALGVVMILSVGYGRNFMPLWAQRVQPTDGTAAEQVTLSDGTWALNLTDDLEFLNQSWDDFKFTKGKRIRRNGYRCDEITAMVCQQYGVPIKQLARGTSYFELSPADTTLVSPLMVIEKAYEQEMSRTGRAYIIRWAAPTRKHPLGALEVVPMRRNPNLLRFREQLTDAMLTRSQATSFATSILGRATLKSGNGKHRKITYHYVNEQAVRRFGFVHKIVDFSAVSSELELQILTKRAMVSRLTPLRTAQLTNPGVATLRRGDAIQISIPEEGYAPLTLDAYGQPRVPQSKQSAKALLLAEQLDPTLFGLVTAAALDPLSAAGLNLSTVSTSDVQTLVPIGDQSIAFVTSAQHTLSAGSYSMDVQTSFVDTLDPATLKAEIEANIRAGKSQQRAQKSTASSAGGSPASPGGWVRVGATIDPTSGQDPPYSSHGGFSFAELLQAGANMGLHPSLTEVLNLADSSRGSPGRPECEMETALWVRLPGGTKQFKMWKNDVGSGQTGQPHFKVDLHQAIADALGWTPNGDIEVKAV